MSDDEDDDGGTSDAFDAVDEVIDDAADAATEDVGYERRYDDDYDHYHHHHHHDHYEHEVEQQRRRMSAQSAAKGSGSKVLFTVIGVVIVCGALGAVLWAVGNAAKEKALAGVAAAGVTGAAASGGAAEASGVTAAAVAASGMATADECEQMFRQGTLLKARQTGSFRRLSSRRQRSRVDRVMRTSKMVRAVRECTGSVPRSLAQCIIAAPDLAAYQACSKQP